MLVKEQGGKINFIDRNDCFVGFDYSQNCCEDFGWYVNSEPSSDDVAGVDDEATLQGFWFDTATEPTTVERAAEEYAYNDDGGTVAFRCVNEAGDVVWLHLYNSHNGYYSHGWKTSWGQSGCL